MPVRFIVTLILAFFLSSELPAIVPEIVGGTTSAGTAVARSKKKSRKKKRRRKRRRRRKVRPPRPILEDDPEAPLGDIWEEHIDEFLKLSKPVYGAFAAIDPATGELIALSEYTRNRNKVPHPGLTAVFPAASVFKIVTAAALMEEKKAGPETITCYRGGRSRLTRYHLSKPPRRRSRCRRLDTAFAGSINAIFGRLAVELLGADTLLSYADRFGFNHDLTIGGLRTRSTARKARSALDLARMAAGFTNSALSPLHAAAIAAVIANRGTLPDGVAVDGKGMIPEADPKRVISRSTADRLKRMMKKTSSGGTASKYFWGLKGRYGKPAVKTGTLTSRDGSGRFNTWMVGFYPASHPEFAFGAVFSVKGGGPIKAGHLTRYAVDMYRRLKKNRVSRRRNPRN